MAERSSRQARKLTKAVCDAAVFDGGWDVLWDTQIPGFGMRLYDGGKKSFVYRYRHNGRKKHMTLGGFGEITVDQARTLALEAASNLRSGIDPSEARRSGSGEITFGAFAEEYLERHSRAHKKTAYEDEGRIDRHIPSTWKSRALSSLTRDDVARLHGEVGKDRPYEANRLLSLLHAMFEKALAWGYLPESYGNPSARIQRFREVSRDRYVSEGEMRRLGNEIDKEPNVFIRAFVWALLLTGARKSELLSRRWDEIDFERGVIKLSTTKSGQPGSIPLSKLAVAVLQEIPHLDDNPYVFPGKRTGQPLINVDKAWRRIRRDAGLEDIRLHDLRRTVGSWMHQQGADLNVVRQALRHREISTTLVYARLGADAARPAMERHAERMVEVVRMHNLGVDALNAKKTDT